MTQTYYPFDGQVVSEANWETMFSAMTENGVCGSPGDSTAQVYADGSGKHVFRRAGSGLLRGGFWNDDAALTVDIADNTSGYPRIDRIVQRRSASANTCVTAYLQGTPASLSAPTPVAPALTRVTGGVWEDYLAQVYVDPGFVVIANGKVTDERRFVGLRSWRYTDQSQLPTSGVPLWQEAVLANGSEVRWNGTAWVPSLAAAASALLRGLGLSNPGFNNAAAPPSAYAAGVSLGNMNGPNGFGPALTFQWDGAYIQFFKDPGQAAMVRSGYGDGTSWGPWQTL